MAIRPSSTKEKQDAAREPASAREPAVTSAAASLDAFGCTFILAPAMSVRISAEDALLLSAFAVADLSILVESECQVRGGDWQAVVPKLGPDARRVHAEENAGGASVISEALSMEVLCRLLGARLVCTELELRYFPAAGPITDYAIALRGGDVLGVSVTRAFSFGEAALSVPHAAALLSKKLAGILHSSRTCFNQNLSKQILHVWCDGAADVALLRLAFGLVGPELSASTLVLVTRCENLPELFTEKGKAPRKRARPLKGLKDEAHLAALAESCPLRPQQRRTTAVDTALRAGSRLRGKN